MKRSFTVGLSLLIVALSLASCGVKVEKGAVFSDELLASVRLEGLPMPEVEAYGIAYFKNDDGTTREDLYFACESHAEFEAYVTQVIEHLAAREDIYYFGYRDTEPSILMLIPDYTIRPIEELDLSYDSIELRYALTDELFDGNLGYSPVEDVELVFTYEEPGKSGYNACLSVDTSPVSAHLGEGMLPESEGVTDGVTDTEAE